VLGTRLTPVGHVTPNLGVRPSQHGLEHVAEAHASMLGMNLGYYV